MTEIKSALADKANRKEIDALDKKLLTLENRAGLFKAGLR